MNQYARILGKEYNKLTKEDLAAIAVSFAMMLLEDDTEKVTEFVKAEKKTLENCGILGGK